MKISKLIYRLLNLYCICTLSSYSLIADVLNKPESTEHSNTNLKSTSEVQEIEPISDEEFGLHKWQRYVRGFRAKHNFTLGLGSSRTTWNFSKVENTTENKTRNHTLLSYFKYHYHLALTYDFGFFVGTSFGIGHETSKRANYRAEILERYPGILTGLVYNIRPDWRAWLSFERHLEKISPFYLNLNSVNQKLGTTITSFDFAIGFDYFFSLTWAITPEFHYRYSVHNKPQFKAQQGQSLLLDFTKEDYWVGIGLTYHPLQ